MSDRTPAIAQQGLIGDLRSAASASTPSRSTPPAGSSGTLDRALGD